jgi:exodeoxyribonuclease V gamma subunit
VCVPGHDDGEFPRRSRRDGDDLILQDPHVGDRDPRAEDRQMLLDALMAATERLIITYTGNDERTNLRRPPAVPVGELLDVIERTAGPEARQEVVICHPLQPFDPRNFITGGLVPDRPWGFDRNALAGAEALSGPRRAPSRLLATALPDQRQDVIELERLVSFAERPVRALLRDRLGISLSESFEEIEDAIPVELDSLEQWTVGQRLLDGVLSGAAIDDCIAAERARGSVPPGELGTAPLRSIKPVVDRIASAARELGEATPTSLDVNVALPDGRRLAGTIAGVCGTTIRTISYSRVRPRERIRAWVRLLPLTLARPDERHEALVIGRARPGAARGAGITVARIEPVAPEEARDQLAAIVDLYDRGMREPLPLACETSAAYVAAGEDAAREAWTTDYGDYDKEDRKPEHVLAFDGQITFDELIARPGFAEYAHRLWDGLLAHERLEDS